VSGRLREPRKGRSPAGRPVFPAVDFSCLIRHISPMVWNGLLVLLAPLYAVLLRLLRDDRERRREAAQRAAQTRRQRRERQPAEAHPQPAARGWYGSTVLHRSAYGDIQAATPRRARAPTATAVQRSRRAV